MFHFFFLEQSLDPAKWWQRRLAYTRSVAVNSIVGYVVGCVSLHLELLLLMVARLDLEIDIRRTFSSIALQQSSFTLILALHLSRFVIGCFFF